MEIRKTRGRCYINGKRVSPARCEQVMIQAAMFGTIDTFETIRKAGRLTALCQVQLCNGGAL